MNIASATPAEEGERLLLRGEHYRPPFKERIFDHHVLFSWLFVCL